MIVENGLVGRARGCPLRVALLAAVVAGCGPTAAPEAAPEDQAKATLEQALQGWRAGRSPAEMKAGSPSIVVGDQSWESGARLARFEVQGSGKPAGAERVFTVKLWTSDAGGKEAEQVVEYKVGTSPILSVFRAIF